MVSVDTEPLVGLVAVVTLPAAALAGIFVGTETAAVVAVVGWLFLVPVLAILSDEEILSVEEEQEEATESASDPLETLRERYARGDIDEAAFERRLERLLETEDVDLPPEAEHEDESLATETER